MEFNNDIIKDIIKTIKYNIIIQLIQLIFLISYFILLPDSFKISFFWLLIIFFLRTVLKFEYSENNLEKIKKYYSISNLYVMLIFIFLCLFLLGLSFFSTEKSELFKFTSILLFLSSFSIVPESFLKVRKDYKRLFKARLISEFSFIIGLILAYKGINESLFYTYILYYLVYAYVLYKSLPISIKPMNGDINLKLKIPSLKYFYLILSYLFFGKDFFAFNFIIIELSFFIKNIFSFLIKYYNFFISKEDKEELLKLNFIRLHEYVYFFSFPIFAILFVFIADFLKYINYSQYIFYAYIILIIGFLNIDFTNIILYSKQKTKAIKNLDIFSFIFFLFVIISGFFNDFIFLIVYFLYNIIRKLLNIIIIKNLLNLDIITKDYFYIFFSGSLSIIGMLFLKEYLVLNIFNVIIIILFGKIIYLLMIYLLSKDILKRTIRYLFNED